jgi:hypothetical protein
MTFGRGVIVAGMRRPPVAGGSVTELSATDA